MPPKRISLTLLDQGERIGRLTVLAWRPQGGLARNLFTLMRHRKREALGPWSREPDAMWTLEELGDELSLLSFNASYEDCREHVDTILASGVLEASGEQIHYVLEDNPRNHWAYRSYRRRPERPYAALSRCTARRLPSIGVSKTSPTSNGCRCRIRLPGGCAWHSGALVSRSTDVRSESATSLSRPPKTRSRVDSPRITTDASPSCRSQGAAPRDISRNRMGKSQRRRSASKGGAGQPGQTTIELVSEVDRTGFAVCRDFDGQYVDLVENLPGMEPVHAGRRGDQPSTGIRDPMGHGPQRVHPSRPDAAVAGRLGRTSRLDRGIRRQWLHRVAHQREAGARRDANLVRFGPGRFAEAARHFLYLISHDSDHPGPIYLADPCFVGHTMADEVAQLFVDMCNAIRASRCGFCARSANRTTPRLGGPGTWGRSGPT